VSPSIEKERVCSLEFDPPRHPALFCMQYYQVWIAIEV
jgi:hypothetical protein